EVQHLNFSYGEQTILKGVNLTIQKNQTVAFVGESGSGKTTLVNVLAGLLPPDSGDFKVDGLSSKELDVASYQQRIGYITQEPVIFNDSIYNNVTLWAQPTLENQQQFEQAIAQASLDIFLHTLPQGQETQLGNNGINLSGGQKQRISIARELFKDIDILIMDEATSALDSGTERDIQESIDQLRGRFTILIVAHRLSTIKNADRIILMKHGRIDSEGDYQNMVQQNRAFKRMVELQEL